MAQVKAIPEGNQTIIPHLVVRGAAEAIEFYKKAFGAVEVSRIPMPDGKLLMHAALKIGGSHLFLCDEAPFPGSCKSPQTLGGASMTLHLNVSDADAVFQQAVAAGAKPTMPPMDMFWGDRYGKLTDPFGHEWSVSSRKEVVSPEEMKKRGEAMAREMAKKPR